MGFRYTSLIRMDIDMVTHISVGFTTKITNKGRKTEEYRFLLEMGNPSPPRGLGCII